MHRFAFFTIILLLTVLNASGQWFENSGPEGSYHELWNYESSILASSSSGGLFKSNDNGITWNAVSTQLSNKMITDFLVKDNYLFVSALEGVFRSSDGGATWIAVNTGIFPIISISSLAVSNGYLVAAGSDIFRSTNNGTTWDKVNTTQSFNKIISYNNYLLFGTTHFGFFSSSDNGTSWTSIDPPLNTFHSPVESLFITDNIIFVSDGLSVYYYDIFRHDWMVDFPSSIHSRSFAKRGELVFTIDHDEIFYCRSAIPYTLWVPLNTGAPETAFFSMIISGNYLFASTYGDKIYRREIEPYLNVTSAPLIFNSVEGLPSSIQSFVIESFIANSINVTSPPEFEFSIDQPGPNQNFRNSFSFLDLSEDESVNDRTIYVRLNASNSGSFSGNIIISSEGTNPQSVSVSGFVEERQNQSITFNSLESNVYGDAPLSLNATSTSGLSISYTSSDESVAKIIGNELTIVGAGNAIVTASQPGNTDFKPAPDILQLLTVTKAILRITAENKTRVYGDTNPLFSMAYEGFRGTDTNLDELPTITSDAISTSGVGTYDIELTGGIDANYSFVFSKGALEITKAPLTVTAENKSKTYGNINPVFTTTYLGFKGTDDNLDLNEPPSITCSATPVSNVGTYAIELSGGSDENYSLTFTNGTLDVTKATLTITADNKTKVYGESNPLLTNSFSGFKNADTESMLESQPLLSASATALSNVGEYEITLSGGLDDLYDFLFVEGILTITKSPADYNV